MFNTYAEQVVHSNQVVSLFMRVLMRHLATLIKFFLSESIRITLINNYLTIIKLWYDSVLRGEY